MCDCAETFYHTNYEYQKEYEEEGEGITEQINEFKEKLNRNYEK